MTDTRSTPSPKRPAPRVCLACHGQRLATLLETASAFRIYSIAPAAVVAEDVWPMPEGGLAALAALLARADVVLMVCGGATCCCLGHFAKTGIDVVPWIAGSVPAVLAALQHNRLDTLLAPGARPARKGCRRLRFDTIPREFTES